MKFGLASLSFVVSMHEWGQTFWSWPAREFTNSLLWLIPPPIMGRRIQPRIRSTHKSIRGQEWNSQL